MQRIKSKVIFTQEILFGMQETPGLGELTCILHPVLFIILFRVVLMFVMLGMEP